MGLRNIISKEADKKKQQPLQNFEGLTDAEIFVKTVGDALMKINPKLMEEENEIKTRQILQLAGKLLGNMTFGKDEHGLANIDFTPFKRAYKKLNK